MALAVFRFAQYAFIRAAWAFLFAAVNLRRPFFTAVCSVRGETMASSARRGSLNK
jgi:hypothetical protein